MNETTPRRRRIVLCMGEFCNMGRRADRLYKRLNPLVVAYNDDQRPPPCKLETANCLSMCAVGPNLIVYPENRVYNGVTEEQIEGIFRENVVEGESS